MQQTKLVKKQFIADLDKNGAPTGWRFKVDRFILFDDGAEKIIPDEIAATAEEVEAHFGTAVTAQAADIAADRAVRDDLVVQLTATSVELQQKTRALSEKEIEMARKDDLISEKEAELAAERAKVAAAEAASLEVAEAVKQ